MTDVAELKRRAKLWPKGHRFEDFLLGRRFTHHWGRTITESDAVLFSTLTLHYNPLYTNAEYARAHGHSGLVVNPLLVFNVVFGLTVEDLSEGGGPFLGVDELVFKRPVYVGDTLSAESEVMAARDSEKRPEFGIVTWRTRGHNQRGDEVISYERTNLVRKRG